MNTLETISYAPGFAFELLDQLVGDLTQEQADWMPPGTANPISALYWHAVAYADQYVHDFCSREGLQVDMAALRDYARATAQTLTDWVASLTAEDLQRTISTSIGDLKLGEVLESFIVGHINWHCGEISALRGCQGLQGYPW